MMHAVAAQINVAVGEVESLNCVQRRVAVSADIFPFRGYGCGIRMPAYRKKPVICVLYVHWILYHKLTGIGDFLEIILLNSLLNPIFPVLVKIKNILNDFKCFFYGHVIQIDLIPFSAADDVVFFRIDMDTVRGIYKPCTFQYRSSVRSNTGLNIH